MSGELEQRLMEIQRASYFAGTHSNEADLSWAAPMAEVLKMFERLENEAHEARTEAEANAMYLRWEKERNAAWEASYNAKVAELNEMDSLLETLLP